jgi:hypothetical protein
MLAPMDERPRQRFDPAGACAVLIATMGTSAGPGAMVGIPAGVFRVYRGYFPG